MVKLYKSKMQDGAVSPVIAVILMVAITVVLAAAVYVWVSGFSSPGAQPAGALALSSLTPLDDAAVPGEFVKAYTVTSASSGLTYGGLAVSLDGSRLAFDDDACAPDAAEEWTACAGTANRAADGLVVAGDVLRFRTATSPARLSVVDTGANSVLLTLAVS